jgi:hypothetical protein
VKNKLRCNPPSEPHGESECSDQRHRRHNLKRHSAFTAQVERDSDRQKDEFHQESRK